MSDLKVLEPFLSWFLFLFLFLFLFSASPNLWLQILDWHLTCNKKETQIERRWLGKEKYLQIFAGITYFLSCWSTYTTFINVLTDWLISFNYSSTFLDWLVVLEKDVFQKNRIIFSPSSNFTRRGFLGRNTFQTITPKKTFESILVSIYWKPTWNAAN
jgi:hypothetical protein